MSVAVCDSDSEGESKDPFKLSSVLVFACETIVYWYFGGEMELSVADLPKWGGQLFAAYYWY